MIIEIEAKTLLSSRKEPAPWSQIKYGMNIYRGCEHQCIYCDELPRKRLIGIVGTGAMSDPYTFAERRYQLTRQALAVLAEEPFPAHVSTRSDMVTRDVDVLQAVARARGHRLLYADHGG